MLPAEGVNESMEKTMEIDGVDQAALLDHIGKHEIASVLVTFRDRARSAIFAVRRADGTLTVRDVVDDGAETTAGG